MRIVCVHSLTAHGVVGMKPFLAVWGTACLPVPSLLLSGPGDMAGCVRVETDVAGLLEGTLAGLTARSEKAVVFIGYLAHAAQAEAVRAVLSRHAAALALVVVDPVSGDDGRCYVKPELLAAWPALLEVADWAVPNLTEVELIAGCSGEAAIAVWRQRWPRLRLIVTGLTPRADEVETRLYEGATPFMQRQARIAGRFNGTGDLFAALWTKARFAAGASPEEAVQQAVMGVARAVALAVAAGTRDLPLH